MEQLKEEGEKEFNKFVNEQLKIMNGHISRLSLRCLNKAFELEKEYGLA